MLTLTSNVNNGIAAQNNQNLFVIFKVELDGGVIERWSYIRSTIVSGDGTYNDRIIKRGNLGSTNKTAGFEDGGGLGSIDTISIVFKSGNDFNNYYPGNSNYLINRKISIGIVYGASVASTDVTWFFYGRISSVEYDYTEMRIGIDDYSEFYNHELPFYSIQTTNNDGVSYFPNVAKEHIGKSIPIVYGDFSWDKTSLLPITSTGVPAYTVSPQTYKQIICSHKIEETFGGLGFGFIYNSEYDCGIWLRNYNIDTGAYYESADVAYSGSSLVLLKGGVGLLVGHVSIYPKYPSFDKNISVNPEFGENGLINAISLAGKKYITFKIGGGSFSPTLGAFAGSRVQKITRVTFYADIFNNAVSGTGKALIHIVDPTAVTYQTGITIASKITDIPLGTTVRCVVDLYDNASAGYQMILANYGWNWLNGIVFKVANDLTGGNLLIQNCFLRVTNFLIGSIETRKTTIRHPGWVAIIFNPSVANQTVFHRYKNLAPPDASAYIALKGYDFKDWID